MASKRRKAKMLRPDGRWNRLAPWPVVAALGGVLAAAVGWCVCAAGCLLGWLQSPDIPVREPLRLAAQFWLAGQFSRVEFAGTPLSIAPLGLTLLLIVVGAGLANLVVEHCFDAPPPPQQRGRWLVRIGGVFVVAYAVVTVFAASGWKIDASPVRTLIGCLAVGVAMSFAGVARTLGWRLELELVRLPWARWLDALPRAVAAGLGTVLAGGGLVVLIALVQHRDRVESIGAGLNAGVLGGVLMLLLQLIWLPNAVLWGVSWVCGAGFSLGTDTVVSPLSTQVGLLPSVPMLGAVPNVGVRGDAMLLWLAVPALAGVVAAWVLLRAMFDHWAGQGSPRPDVSALAGVLAGGLAGAIAAAAVTLSGGDLGRMRLIGLGPVQPALVPLCCGTMGAAGLLLGLIWGWRRYVVEGRAAPRVVVARPIRDVAPRVEVADRVGRPEPTRLSDDTEPDVGEPHEPVSDPDERDKDRDEPSDDSEGPAQPDDASTRGDEPPKDVDEVETAPDEVETAPDEPEPASDPGIDAPTDRPPSVDS